METDTGRSSVDSALKELHAYAKLLFLRSGRQYEDKASYRELEEDVPLDESENDGDSCENVLLGNLDVDFLRREFLDRLSETVSSTKGGRHVVASYMFYWPDKVKVFVAINSGFAEGDALSKFLGNLCASLKEIAAAPDNQTEEHTDTLWNILLCHQSSRLRDIIIDLRDIMKNFQHLLPQHSSSEPSGDGILSDIAGILPDFEDCLKLLAKLVFGDDHSGVERHSGLVSLSYALYRAFPAEHFQALGRAGDKLRQNTGFLGRLQTAFQVLVEASRRISGFDELSLIPVTRLKTREKPSSQEWSLTETLCALNLQLTDEAIEKLMRSSNSKLRWTKSKLLAEFSRQKSPTWEVHAEIQLIIFVLSHSSQVANGKRFDYIGCSRYSCLLCSKFLHDFQVLKTRGCHGKLYNHSWTLPLGHNLGQSEQHMLCGTLMKVITWMRKELIDSVILSAQRRAEAKESTIGGSLISILEKSQENHQRSHAVSEHLRRQRAQNYRVRESLLSPVEDEEASKVQTRHEALTDNTAKLCVGCWEVETTRLCSHCQGSVFCGKDCERKMPLSHLLQCNMRQVTSADYLYQDIREDELPTDPQVRQDYWFDRCQDKDEDSALLGTFVGLLYKHPNHITREELHLWRSNPGGNPYLVAKIIEKFEELTNNNRGGYFPWFLRQRTHFELPDGHHSIPKAPSPMAQLQNMQAKARKYLAPGDQCKDIEDLTPFAKMHCFLFYAMALNKEYPPPVNRENCHWFDFGFVVSHDQHEERILGSMYLTMLFGSISQEEYARSIGSSTLPELMNRKDPTCNFNEFWKAWETGKLMTMFHKCLPDLMTMKTFMSTEYDLFNRLHAFFEAETPRPSIWRLRHFLAMDDVSVESAASDIAWAARDYGFSEQLDTRTTIELRNFYKQLLKKAEPLVIHCERMKGNLVDLAERHINITSPRVKELLKSLQ